MRVETSVSRSKNVRWHFAKLGQSALGGAVVAALLLFHSSLASTSLQDAKSAFETFRESTLEANSRFLLSVIVLGWVGFGLSGFKFSQPLVKWVVRPALRFCVDLCATAVGGLIVWWLWIVLPTLKDALIVLGFGVTSVFVAWAVFSAALYSSRPIRLEKPPKQGGILARAIKSSKWIRLAGAVIALTVISFCAG